MSYIALTQNDISNLNYTNLYLAEILISDYIQNQNNYIGLTRAEIAARWKNDERYRKQFYPSYCQRKLEQSGGILVLEGERYKINEPAERLSTLLDGVLLQEVAATIDRPSPVIANIDHFENITNKQAFFSSLKEYLLNGSPNDFEVIAYAILYTYLDIFGFSLKRFTSTNANDAGVDYIGGDVIYCVTTNLTVAKLESDINKTHARKVFIHRNTLSGKVQNLINEYVRESKISDVLNANMMVERYIEYLEGKHEAYNIMEKLRTILINEYSKEIV